MGWPINSDWAFRDFTYNRIAFVLWPHQSWLSKVRVAERGPKDPAIWKRLTARADVIAHSLTPKHLVTKKGPRSVLHFIQRSSSIDFFLKMKTSNKKLLVTVHLTTSNKKLLVAPGITTSSKKLGSSQVQKPLKVEIICFLSMSRTRVAVSSRAATWNLHSLPSIVQFIQDMEISSPLWKHSICLLTSRIKS